jgi:hypothetical protein
LVFAKQLFSWEQIQLIGEIGGGSFSTVHRGILDGKVVAIKTIDLQKIVAAFDPITVFSEFRKEVARMRSLAALVVVDDCCC